MVGVAVTQGLIEKPRWMRDLQRFLPLRSQFVLSGNVRDLQVHEPAPGTITAAGLPTVLIDQLKKAGYQRIVTFDPVSGFRGIPAGSNSSEADETLKAVGLMPTMGLYRLTDAKQKLDTNEATGSFDPSLFFSGRFAIDEASYATLMTSGLRYFKYLLSA